MRRWSDNVNDDAGVVESGQDKRSLSFLSSRPSALIDNGFLRAAAALFVHPLSRYPTLSTTNGKSWKTLKRESQSHQLLSRLYIFNNSKSSTPQLSLRIFQYIHVCPFPRRPENTCFSPSLCSAKTTEKGAATFPLSANPQRLQA